MLVFVVEFFLFILCRNFLPFCVLKVLITYERSIEFRSDVIFPSSIFEFSSGRQNRLIALIREESNLGHFAKQSTFDLHLCS